MTTKQIHFYINKYCIFTINILCMAKKKFRVSCPRCGNWILNADSLPETTAVFNCSKCKKGYELSELIVK